MSNVPEQVQPVQPAASHAENSIHPQQADIGVVATGDQVEAQKVHEELEKIGGGVTHEATPITAIKGDVDHEQFEEPNKLANPEENTRGEFEQEKHIQEKVANSLSPEYAGSKPKYNILDHAAKIVGSIWNKQESTK